MRKALYALCVISCLFFILWTGRTASSAAKAAESLSGGPDGMPAQCKQGKTSTQSLGWRWTSGARVKVYYLNGHFKGEEKDALSRAVHNWNDALADMEPQIGFAVRGEREGVAESDASITVMRGIPKGKDRVGEIKYYSLSNGVQYMVVIVGPDVTDIDELTSLMAHEIGHSLGLADCYGCQRGTTTMAAFRDNNKGNGVYAPSECDQWVVAQGYGGQIRATVRLVSSR